MTIQRRIVKSPFTKEEREGVFVTREESRLRRNKMKIYTVISYSYDYYEYENWVMSTINKDKLNEYVETIKDENIKNEELYGHEPIEIFFVQDGEGVSENKHKRHKHIRVYITEE